MKNKKKGVALVSVMLILTALMVMTMGFAAFTTTDHAISQSYYSTTVTFYLAQAGLEYFHFLLKHNMLVFPIIAYSPYSSVGQCVNVFDTGEESMVIYTLTWGNVGEMFHTDRYIGTFRIQATEMQDDNASNANKRVLYVTSVGMVKERPASASGAPDTWNFEDASFTIKARRTLIMRVPFSQFSDMRLNFGGTNRVYYETLNDAWYERYR